MSLCLCMIAPNPSVSVAVRQPQSGPRATGGALIARRNARRAPAGRRDVPIGRMFGQRED